MCDMCNSNKKIQKIHCHNCDAFKEPYILLEKLNQFMLVFNQLLSQTLKIKQSITIYMVV